MLGFIYFYILYCSYLANVNNNTIPYHMTFLLFKKTGNVGILSFLKQRAMSLLKT